MGALADTSYDDGEDDGTDIGPAVSSALQEANNPLAGAPKGMLQQIVAEGRDQTPIHSALKNVAQALKGDSNMDQIQALFSAAGALGAPTRTGSIGETAANLGKSLSATLGEQNAANRQDAATLAKLQFDEAKAEMASRRALANQALKALGAQSPNDKKVGSVVLGAPDPRTGAQQSYQYIADPDHPGRLSLQIARIYLPGDARPSGATDLPPGVIPPTAPMPTEGDIDPSTGKIRSDFGAAAAPSQPDVTPPGTVPLKAINPNPTPLKGLVGTPRELEAKYHLKDSYGIDLSGLDQDTPVHIDMENGKPTAPPDINPLAKYNNAVGDDLLAQLDPADKAAVMAYRYGAVAPPNPGVRNPAAQRIAALATAAFPGVNFAENYQTGRAFSANGPAGKNLIKTGTAIDHALELDKAVDGLRNVDLSILSGPVNATKNYLTSKNDPAIGRYRLTRDQFVKEVEAAITGGSTSTIQAFNTWKQNFNDAATPDVLHGLVKQGVQLLAQRMNEQVEPWNKAFGANRSAFSFVPSSALTKFRKLDPSFDYTPDDLKFAAAEKLKEQHAPAGSATSAATFSAPAAAPVPKPELMSQAKAALSMAKGDSTKVRAILDRTRQHGASEADIGELQKFYAGLR